MDLIPAPYRWLGWAVLAAVIAGAGFAGGVKLTAAVYKPKVAAAEKDAADNRAAYLLLAAQVKQAAQEAQERAAAAASAQAEAKARADKQTALIATLRGHLAPAYALGKTCPDALKEIREDLTHAQIF